MLRMNLVYQMLFKVTIQKDYQRGYFPRNPRDIKYLKFPPIIQQSCLRFHFLDEIIEVQDGSNMQVKDETDEKDEDHDGSSMQVKDETDDKDEDQPGGFNSLS